MIETTASNAFERLFDKGVLGIVLVLLILLYIVTFRVINGYLNEAKQALKEEREAHQKTKDAQIADLRDMAKLPNAIESMRAMMERNMFGRSGN